MEQAMSPLPVKVSVRDENPVKGEAFLKALQDVINGGKVTRLEWDDRECYIFMNGEFLSLHKPEGNFQWIIQEVDMQADDWMTV